MKKSISVSNLTLDLYLDYVLPAARAARVVEEVPACEGDREFIAQVIDAAAADEITHCMYRACMNAHVYNGDYSGIGEAARMLHQLEVSIEYHNDETVTAIYNALSAMLAQPETREPEQNDQNEQEEETMTETRTAADLIRENLNISTRSAWMRGVAQYAADLLGELDEAERGGWVDHDVYQSPALLRRTLLNGASDWKQYSEGGCSMIFDAEIAERLCTASELKLTRNGQRKPNSRESWLDVQARALYQAAECIARAAANIAE